MLDSNSLTYIYTATLWTDFMISIISFHCSMG